MVRDGRMMERKLTTAEVVTHLTSCVGRSGEAEAGAGLARMESTVYNTTSSGPIVNYNFDFLDREKYR